MLDESKVVLYYLIPINNEFKVQMGFYTPKIFDECYSADIFLAASKADNQKALFERLRDKAAIRCMEVVGEVIVCEDNDTIARDGWRKAVDVALANKAGCIMVWDSWHAVAGKAPFREAREALDALGIRLIV